MILMQILLIVALVFLAGFVLTRRHTHAGRAWQKLILIGFFILAFIVVLFPEVTNVVAHFFGIGRGTDLLLYITVLLFIFYALNSYLKQQEQRDTLYRLARKIALLEANNKK